MSIKAKLTTFDQQCRDFHQTYLTPSWLSPSRDRLYICLALIMAIIAIAANGHMRSWQFAQWQAAKDIYFIGDMPSVSTADAGFFLATAKALKAENTSDAFLQKRFFPNKRDQQDNPDQRLTNEQLLSLLIAYFAPDASNKALLETAHAMLPITAMITAIAIICLFGTAGFWWEGAIAALGGGLSFSYLSRSAVGRIDTDQLNLAFFYAVTALVLLAARIKSWRAGLLVSIVAGGMNWLFSWWYTKDIFSWFFLGVLIWVGLMTHRDLKRVLVQAGIFILLSGTFINMGGVDLDMFTDSNLEFGTLVFPNTLQTITELNVIAFADLLRSISGHPAIGAFGILCLMIWVIFNPVIGIAMMPILALGLLNFIFGNRVVFFAAPIVWFGVAWGLFSVIRFSTSWLIHRFFATSAPAHMPSYVTFSAVMILPISALVITAIIYLQSYNPFTRPYIPKPSFSREVLTGFATLDSRIKSRPDAKQAVIASWWDYGYMATFLSDLPSLHDGSSQISPVTHYIARALTADSQAETAAILTFLAQDGLAGLRSKSAVKGAVEAYFETLPNADKTDIYLVLTQQMVPWMGAISQLGMWDAENGKPINIRPGTNSLEFQTIRCKNDNSASQLICAGNKFDLAKGTIDQNPLIGRVVKTYGGKVVAQKQYPHQQGLVMQAHDLGNARIQTQILHPRLYQSSFNQLFYLNAENPRYFSLIDDKFPFYRVYKVKN
ncbi:dolichyl-diphosphooligosaccharide--protein glycosyltransferase subunit STT3 [Alphaproteobacteria bacterium]|nr:dolichyl-diphosphooligosaccharide--protein glycosyltransferase subunit STT3 [Alphaproteobacteria bacterium]